MDSLGDLTTHYAQFLKPLTLAAIRDMAVEKEKEKQTSSGSASKSLVGYLDKLLAKPQNSLNISMISTISNQGSTTNLHKPSVSKNMFGKALGLIVPSSSSKGDKNKLNETVDQSIASAASSPKRESETNRSSLQQL